MNLLFAALLASPAFASPPLPTQACAAAEGPALTQCLLPRFQGLYTRYGVFASELDSRTQRTIEGTVRLLADAALDPAAKPGIKRLMLLWADHAIVSEANVVRKAPASDIAQERALVAEMTPLAARMDALALASGAPWTLSGLSRDYWTSVSAAQGRLDAMDGRMRDSLGIPNRPDRFLQAASEALRRR